MEALSKIILIISIIWPIWQLIQLRRRMIHGELIVPLVVAATLIFSLCVLGVLVLSVSPFHLIWLFFLSFILGTVLLFFPWFQTMLMTGLVLLVMTTQRKEGKNIQAMTETGAEKEERYTAAKRRKKKRKRRGKAR